MRRSTILVLVCLVVTLWNDVKAQVSEAPQTSHFRKVVLESEVTDPMELDVAADGRVFWIERQGPIRVWDSRTGRTHLAGSLPSLMVIEDGASGLALDPDFLQNGWLYVYYAPATKGPNRLSRFTYRDGQIDFSTEKVLLEVPVQREFCCHSAGYVTFGPDGLLWLSTGDNTHNMDPRGAPLNEMSGFEFADAQRSAGNTNDLRGKILRIRPLPDGTYEIPEGNLFEPDTKHRGEIYTMGHRNPWRFSVDPEAGWLFWGDVGLGSGADPERGPNGWEEFNLAKGPGFYGWPYFAGPNEAYHDYDYATGTPGPAFDPTHPINDSPNNTGARELPPAQPALIWYFYGQSEEFPELGVGGMSASAGPVYRRPSTAGPNALPEYYEGAFLAYEWMRNWIKAVRLDEQGHLVKIEDFLPGMEFARPTDIKVGPDGELYIIEWGTDFWGSNEDAQIVRVEYTGGKLTPPPPAVQDQQPEDITLAIEWPKDGGFFEYGQPFSYMLSGGHNPTVDIYTGHDTHQHLIETKAGMQGTVHLDRQAYVHHPDLHLSDRFAVLEARSGAHSVLVKLHPKRFDAEFTSARTAARQSLGGHPAGKGYAETAIIALEGRNGEWAAYEPVNLSNIDSLTFRVKPLAKSTIEVRIDDQDGPLLATVALDSVASHAEKPVVPVQKKFLNEIFDQAMAAEASAYLPDPDVYEGWYDVTVPIEDPGGRHSLFLIFHGAEGEPLAQVDWVQFNGAGMMVQR